MPYPPDPPVNLTSTAPFGNHSWGLSVRAWRIRYLYNSLQYCKICIKTIKMNEITKSIARSFTISFRKIIGIFCNMIPVIKVFSTSGNLWRVYNVHTIDKLYIHIIYHVNNLHYLLVSLWKTVAFHSLVLWLIINFLMFLLEFWRFLQKTMTK